MSIGDGGRTGQRAGAATGTEWAPEGFPADLVGPQAWGTLAPPLQGHPSISHQTSLALGLSPLPGSGLVPSGKNHQATWRVTRVAGIPQSSENLEAEARGRMSQGGEGRKATLLPRTRRLARPGHTESLWVLLEGLKAGPTDVGTWGAPCPPLQGTVQAPRTGGHIWEGARAEGVMAPHRSKAVPAPLPHTAGRPDSGHCSGQALPPSRQGPEPGRQTVRRLIGTPVPLPLPEVHRPGLGRPSARKLSLTVRTAPSSPGRALQPSKSHLRSQRARSKPLSRLEASGGGAQDSGAGAAKGAGCPPPACPHPPPCTRPFQTPPRAGHGPGEQSRKTKQQRPGLEGPGRRCPPCLSSACPPGTEELLGLGRPGMELASLTSDTETELGSLSQPPLPRTGTFARPSS